MFYFRIRVATIWESSKPTGRSNYGHLVTFVGAVYSAKHQLCNIRVEASCPAIPASLQF